MVITRKPKNKYKYCSEVNENSFPDTLENNGSNKNVNPMEKIKAINDKRIASQRNWPTNEIFSAPKTFRTPISTALFEDLAVERFIKLTQAIKRMTKAIE